MDNPSFTRVALGLLMALAGPVAAEVRTDGSLGAKQTFTGTFKIPASLGKQKGGNLFHSFDTFNLTQGESATFTGPSSVKTVIARVTGGQASSIDGTLGCDIANADLYFINPAGVMFGPNASLDLKGSFAVTTADYLKLGSSGRFSSSLSTRSVLTFASPSAFGFLGNRPGRISIQRGSDSPPFGVRVGQGLSVVGGDITVDGGMEQGGGIVIAPAGRINLVSTQSAGELKLDIASNASPPDTSTFSRLGQIDVFNQARIQSTGAGGGLAVVRAGNLRIDSAEIDADSAGAVNGIGIDIRVGTLEMVNRAALTSTAYGKGDGGTIHVTANAIRLDGHGSFSGILTQTGDHSDGNGGSLFIKARTIEIRGGSQMSATALGTGRAGDIHIIASSLFLDSTVANSDTFSSISAQSSPVGAGRGGNIIIRTGSLELVAGAGISNTARNRAGGGGINLTASSIVVDGSSIDSSTDADGKGGDVSIRAGRLTVIAGGGISADTSGTGDAGHVRIFSGGIAMDGSAAPVNFTGISAASIYGDSGKAGDVTVFAAHNIKLVEAEISTNSARGGGNLSVRAGGSIQLDGGSLLSAQAVGNGATLRVTAPLLITLAHGSGITTQSGGNGGNITLDPLKLSLFGGSAINANGGANGGNISINATATPGAVFRGPTANVTATGTTGASGGVATNPANTDVTRGLARLPVSLLSSEAKLQLQCGEGAAFSSFLLTGKGGLTLEPGQLQPALDLSWPWEPGKN